MGFPNQEYWSRLPFPSPRDLTDPGIESVAPVAPALTPSFFTIEQPEKPMCTMGYYSAIKKGMKYCHAQQHVPGASVRNSAHGKGHEEGGLAYAKA